MTDSRRTDSHGIHRPARKNKAKQQAAARGDAGPSAQELMHDGEDAGLDHVKKYGRVDYGAGLAKALREARLTDPNEKKSFEYGFKQGYQNSRNDAAPKTKIDRIVDACEGLAQRVDALEKRRDASFPTKAERDRDAALRREEQSRDNNRTVKVKSRGDTK